MNSETHAVLLPDESFLQAAKTLIRDARKTIYISSFKLELTAKPRGKRLLDLFHQLAMKADAGVDVRILTNIRADRPHIPASNTYAVKMLQQKGIEIRKPRDERVCHAKVIIADHKKAIIGSHNLSVKSCHSNFEVSVLLTEVGTINVLAAFFLHTWDKSVKV